ncbi:MAG: esterase [Ignavibacteriales bacterium]|nr:esterase [Ignavibacteriales bacterium]
MLVFGYGGFPVILFPSAKGRYYQNKDFGLIDSISLLIDAGVFKIYCPDGIDSDSWFNHSIHPSDRVKTHNGYENLILYDVIAFAEHETGYKKVLLAGCGFGGYHAANIAFRHPDLVNSLVCIGSSFDIKQFIFGYYDENCYFNNPPDYLPNLNDPWNLDKIKNMEIILGTGEWDENLNENYRLSGILKEKEIPHWLDVRLQTGGDWHWWKQMFLFYLERMKEKI